MPKKSSQNSQNQMACVHHTRRVTAMHEHMRALRRRFNERRATSCCCCLLIKHL